MKRLHIHISVPDLDKSIDFYNTLFEHKPDVVKPDYAKWMLDEPAVNFAISTGGNKTGLNHLGFQVDSDEQVDAIQARLDEAQLEGVEEKNANCCYANSNKYWTMDPAGIPWENFHTLGEIPMFGDASEVEGCCSGATTEPESAGCCTPSSRC